MPKVKNMISHRSNREVANQFIITMDDGTEIFQSYNTVIASQKGNTVTIDEGALNYSRTTSKYLYQFLNSDRKNINENGYLFC